MIRAVTELMVADMIVHMICTAMGPFQTLNYWPGCRILEKSTFAFMVSMRQMLLKQEAKENKRNKAKILVLKIIDYYFRILKL